MTPLKADTLAINRLTVRSRQSRIGKQLSEHLSDYDWPDAAGEEWVFIRRIQLRAYSNQLPRHLFDQIEYCTTGGGATDDVVRFASLAELLAALLNDLRLGRAGLRWYWRHWADWFELPLSEALYRALAEHLLLLPSIVSRLAERHCLTELWLSLNPDDSHRLAQELAVKLGFRLPVWPDETSFEIEESSVGISSKDRETVLGGKFVLGPHLQSQWRTALQRLDYSDPRYRLALLIIAWEAAPLLLQQAPQTCLAALSRQFAQAFSRSDDTPLPHMTGKDRSRGNRNIQPIRSIDRQRAEREEAPFRKPATSPNQTSPSLDAESAISAQVAASSGSSAISSPVLELPKLKQTEARLLSPAQVASVADAEQQEAWQLQTGSEAVFDRFDTEQGGLLYLLNMLNRPEMRRLMIEHAEALPNAWAWLYRLGQELQLDEQDPIVDFIAQQLGMRDRSELVDLPALPGRKQILELAERWYQKTEVWQPDLLTLPAQIRYSPSHIDLYAAMASIRLPVRLAGLDIDPGWLPWLGRVVRFHYD